MEFNIAEKYNESIFESIKHVNEYGQEFWYARELQPVLEYVEWRKFNGVIEKAMEACESSNNKVSDHFVEAAKMIEIGKGAVRDEKLRRENIQGKDAANRTHYEVGKKVRQTIKELGGTMPENLPTPGKSIKELEKEKKKLNG